MPDKNLQNFLMVPSLNGTVCLSIWKGRDHRKGLGKGYGGRGQKECRKTEYVWKDGTSAERRNNCRKCGKTE